MRSDGQRAGRLAYVVDHSFPYSSDGYAVRSHGVAGALAAHGFAVHACSRPGYPWTLPGFAATEPVRVHRRDGVAYLFEPDPENPEGCAEARGARAGESLAAMFRVLKPAAVLAASNWENARPALTAANRLGLPFFYEVRGFWEISRVAREPAFAGSAEFQDHVAQETRIARAAERVFTLTRFMRDELVRRGVEAGKIDVVPNGYLGRLPSPRSRRPERPGQAGQVFTVGFIGSLTVYEGLEDLVRACAGLRRSGLDVRLLIVGSSVPSGFVSSEAPCPVATRLQRLAAELDPAAWLRTAGRVAPEALPPYYDEIDLVVIPRKPFEVCELVSPIKPLEAAAQGCAMLCSDVAPLAELAESAGVALFRKGDREDLQRRMGELLLDPARRHAMGARARRWVEQECGFDRVVRPMVNAFEAARSGGRVSSP